MPYYQVSAWSRVQTETTVPTFAEIGPVLVTGGEEGAGLAWSRELFSDGSITAATTPTKMPSSVAERLRDMVGKPMELALHRDGILVMRGPLVAWQIEGSSLILNARGLLYYLRYMTLTTDEDYDDNQILIAKDLIDMHQAKDWGNFGLVTTSMTAAGEDKVRTYKASELINVNDEIRELGESDDGFEISVSSATRIISCHNPQKGTDKSLTVALDARGIVSPSFSDSVGAGQFGTGTIVSGIVADADALTSEFIDISQETFGLAYVAHSSLGVPNATELAAVAGRTSNIARKSVFIPPHNFWSMQGASVDDFDVGDTITVEYDAGFGSMTYVGRVKNQFISVQEGGQDKLTVEFI